MSLILGAYLLWSISPMGISALTGNLERVSIAVLLSDRRYAILASLDSNLSYFGSYNAKKFQDTLDIWYWNHVHRSIITTAPMRNVMSSISARFWYLDFLIFFDSVKKLKPSEFIIKYWSIVILNFPPRPRALL